MSVEISVMRGPDMEIFRGKKAWEAVEKMNTNVQDERGQFYHLQVL